MLSRALRHPIKEDLLVQSAKKIGKKVEKAISKTIPHEHSAQKRAAMAATKEQLDFYKSQKEELHKESERVKEQRQQEQKRLHEKQIRSMRRSFRSPGFMEGPETGTKEKLG